MRSAVAGTYALFDMPTICSSCQHRGSMRVLIVEDEPYMAEAIRDGLRLEAIAADIAGDGKVALELLDTNSYDIAVLDRDIPGPSGDEIARRIVASGSGMPILMLTAADRLDRLGRLAELGFDDVGLIKADPSGATKRYEADYSYEELAEIRALLPPTSPVHAPSGPAL
jgi:CheY-like chemotaxis protein